jgi:hypothetical protein
MAAICTLRRAPRAGGKGQVQGDAVSAQNTPSLSGQGAAAGAYWNMTKYRNYWRYSTGCFAVWGVLLAIVAAQRKSDKTHTALLVFGRWVIAWVSGTIARFVYPPPSRWLPPRVPVAGK